VRSLRFVADGLLVEMSKILLVVIIVGAILIALGIYGCLCINKRSDDS
jgi:hypothetical protein